MAKKGGVSEINGFVSVKNDERKTTTKKIVKRDSSVASNKSNSDVRTAKGQTSDSQKVKNTANLEPKLKSNVQSDPKSRRLNENEISKTQKTKVTDHKGQKEKSEGKTAPSKDSTPNDSSRLKRSIAQEPSKTSKPANSSVKSKLSGSTTKIISSNSTKNEKKSSVDPKLKTSLADKKKEATTKKVIEASSSRKAPISKQTISQGSSGIKPSKNVVAKNTSNSTPSKVNVSSVKKPSNDSSKKPIKTNASPNAVIAKANSKISSVVKKKDETPKDNTSNKSSFKEQSSAKVKEIVSQTQKSEATPDEQNITSSYKDLIYFEVDVGTGNESSKKKTSITEVVQLLQTDARLDKNETSQNEHKTTNIIKPPLSAISRQGTFTKEDSENSSAHLTLPDIDHIDITTENKNASDDEEYDYEDDFEDYESDFEEYVSESGVSSESESLKESVKTVTTKSEVPTTGLDKSVPVTNGKKVVEEEKKLDSGNYDLTTKVVLPQTIKEKQLAQIKEAISRENSLYSESAKEVDTIPESNEVVVLDFLSAFKKQEEEEVKKKTKSRSSLILEMIQLHVQDISLFEQEFFYLDDIDSLYKNRYVSHAATEAEVLMRNEDIQTEDIRVSNKWTQFPICYHNWKDSTNPLEIYIEDQRGFGGDNITVDVNNWLNPYYNPEKLYNFIESAGQVVLIMLEEEERWNADRNVAVHKAKHDHGFSRGYIPIQTKNVNFLKSRPICDILFSPHNPNIFLSSHRFVKEIENLSTFEDQFLGRSVMCLWSILEPSQPLSMFVASCQISAISFDIVRTNLLYAGLTDGSVCLWDISERTLYHKETLAGSMEFLLRTPTYSSSHLWGDDYHNNVVVAVQSLGYEIQGRSVGKFSPSQVITLDADGKVIIWIAVVLTSNIDSEKINMEKQDFGQVFWGRFKLVPSRTLSPAKNLPAAQNNWSLQFLCMSLTPQTNRSVLIGTNRGCVVQCHLSEEKPNIPLFCNKEETDCITSVTSLEKSPHELPVFLAGCSNGTIRIHILDRKRPVRILMMDSLMKGYPVTKIKWSLLGPGLFFISDKSLSLHIWDLCKNESTPLLSLSMKKMKATHYDISSDNKHVYIALVVHKDRLEIHRLKEQFTPDEPYPNNKDRETFMSFIDKCCY